MGFTELVLFALLALIVLGPKRMPEMLRTVGKLVGDAKRAADELQGDVRSELAKAEGEMRGVSLADATGKPKQLSNMFASVPKNNSSQDDLILRSAREATDYERALQVERSSTNANAAVTLKGGNSESSVGEGIGPAVAAVETE